MADVFGGISFAAEYVSQMGTASRAEYFGTIAIGILHPFDRPFDLIIETGPSTMGYKFIG